MASVHGLLTRRFRPQATLAAKHPIVLQVDDTRVKPEYHNVVLQQDTKKKHDNSRMVWSYCKEEDVELHLYSDTEGRWCLSNKYPPAAEESACIAYFEGGSVAPPGAHVWKLAKSMFHSSVDSEDGDGFAHGKLMLLCGDAGAARAVRVTHHTFTSA